MLKLLNYIARIILTENKLYHANSTNHHHRPNPNY